MPDIPFPVDADCQEMDPGVAIQVGATLEDGTIDPAAWNTIGCCISSHTPPSLDKASSKSAGCLNIACDPADEEDECNEGPAESIPGEQNESFTDFQIPFYPGAGTVTEWFETMQNCCNKVPWRFCYPNGVKQVLTCAYVKSHTPQASTVGADKQRANVQLALCGNWYYE